jgi:protein O-mannosyl-transferase
MPWPFLNSRRAGFFESVPGKLIVCALLTALAIAVFESVRFADFINYDDPTFITNFPRVQQGLTTDNFWWAMTTQYKEYWHPLVWLSHMLDCQLFGLHPAGHHLMNLGFHIVGTLSVYLALASLTGKGGRSAVVAALFAIHPLHVESVAWVTERKDVMMMPFFMATLACYAAYVRRRSLRWYAMCAACFVLTLMCKPIGMTLPGVLLLMDFWPLGRAGIRWRPLAIGQQPAEAVGATASLGRLIVEKLPLIAIALASLLFTLRGQADASAVIAPTLVPLGLRIENASLAILFYLEKLVVPTNLSVFYPYSRTIPVQAAMAALSLELLITLGVLRWGARRPYLAVGWFWFLGTLLPVIGLIQVGPQAMADRYTYLPSIGIFFAVVWLIADTAEGHSLVQRMNIAIALGLIVTFALIARAQVGYWKNTQALFAHALEVTDNNWLAHYEMGLVHNERGEFGAAAREFAETIQLNPGYAMAYNELGNCIFLVNPQQSIQWFRQAVDYAPREFIVHYNLASALLQTGDSAGAAEEYHEALKIDPDSANAQRGLDIAMSKLAHAATSQSEK